MTEGLFLLLVGAGIGLVSGLVGAWVQHSLSLREDRIRRRRDREEREERELREKLIQGIEHMELRMHFVEEMMDRVLQSEKRQLSRSERQEGKLLPEPGQQEEEQGT